MLITFDVETLPSNDVTVIAEIAASIQAPANYKKPESIAEWMAENKEAAIAEKLAKTSFDGLYGRIACIAWAIDDDPATSTLATDDEASAIDAFFAAIIDASLVDVYGSQVNQSITFVGHNIAGFDLPFLKHRAIINGIKPPSPLRSAFSAKPWGNEIVDTMLMWSADREKRVSMDKLCKVFGIQGKGDFDGSMVASTWPTDPQKVIDYCKDDVDRTRHIYKRLMFL